MGAPDVRMHDRQLCQPSFPFARAVKGFQSVGVCDGYITFDQPRPVNAVGARWVLRYSDIRYRGNQALNFSDCGNGISKLASDCLCNQEPPVRLVVRLRIDAHADSW